MDTFDRIQQLMERNHETQADLAKSTGMSTGLLSQWKSRMQNPSIAKLTKVAEHYGVSVDYLLGKERKEKTVSRSGDISDDDIKFALFDGAPVTDAQFEEVKRFAKYIADRDIHSR